MAGGGVEECMYVCVFCVHTYVCMCICVSFKADACGNLVVFK